MAAFGSPMPVTPHSPQWMLQDPYLGMSRFFNVINHFGTSDRNCPIGKAPIPMFRRASIELRLTRTSPNRKHIPVMFE